DPGRRAPRPPRSRPADHDRRDGGRRADGRDVRLHRPGRPLPPLRRVGGHTRGLARGRTGGRTSSRTPAEAPRTDSVTDAPAARGAVVPLPPRPGRTDLADAAAQAVLSGPLTRRSGCATQGRVSASSTVTSSWLATRRACAGAG